MSNYQITAETKVAKLVVNAVKGGIFSVIRRNPADGSTPFLMVVNTADIKPV